MYFPDRTTLTSLFQNSECLWQCFQVISIRTVWLLNEKLTKGRCQLRKSGQVDVHCSFTFTNNHNNIENSGAVDWYCTLPVLGYTGLYNVYTQHTAHTHMHTHSYAHACKSKIVVNFLLVNDCPLGSVHPACSFQLWFAYGLLCTVRRGFLVLLTVVTDCVEGPSVGCITSGVVPSSCGLLLICCVQWGGVSLSCWLLWQTVLRGPV